MNRRHFMRAVLATGALAVADRTIHPTLAGFALDQKRRFAPVKISRDRLIREVVGLRPYRSQGFVVRAERFGDKLLIHNYGHGGAGVTLSWGTAALAVDLVREATLTPRSNDYAVLGCGVSGLSTARLLQRRGAAVTIYAKDLPPETTSNVAGALWQPTSSYSAQDATAQFTEQFHRACQISNRAFQTLVGPEYGVRWTEAYELLVHPESLERELAGGNALYPELVIHKKEKHYFGFDYVKQYNTMIIEPHTYLRAVLRDFYVAGGKVEVREFQNQAELAKLSEPVIFNCTGLGSRQLFDDRVLIPVRGQLEVLLPQPEIDYCYLSGATYMFPRRDGIILGGTFDYDHWSLDPDPEQTDEIFQAHTEIMKKVK